MVSLSSGSPSTRDYSRVWELEFMFCFHSAGAQACSGAACYHVFVPSPCVATSSMNPQVGIHIIIPSVIHSIFRPVKLFCKETHAISPHHWASEGEKSQLPAAPPTPSLSTTSPMQQLCVPPCEVQSAINLFRTSHFEMQMLVSRVRSNREEFNPLLFFFIPP